MTKKKQNRPRPLAAGKLRGRKAKFREPDDDNINLPQDPGPITQRELAEYLAAETEFIEAYHRYWGARWQLVGKLRAGVCPEAGGLQATLEPLPEQRRKWKLCEKVLSSVWIGDLASVQDHGRPVRLRVTSPRPKPSPRRSPPAPAVKYDQDDNGLGGLNHPPSRRVGPKA